MLVISRNILINKFFSKKIIQYFLNKRNKTILVDEEVLSVEKFRIEMQRSFNSINYNDLYFKYFAKIDNTEATKFIKQCVEIINNERIINSNALKTHIYAYFIDFPFQLVEYFIEKKTTKKNIAYIGNKKTSEYLVLKEIFESIAIKKIKNPIFLFYLYFDLLKNLKKRIIKSKLLNYNSFKKRFENIILEGLPIIDSNKKTILFAVSEERRFSRINEISKYFINQNYNILIYCSLPKLEINIALLKYPELKNYLISDNLFINEGELRSIFQKAELNSNKLHLNLTKKGVLDNATYKSVKLLKIFWDEILTIIKLRSIEIDLVDKVTSLIINQYKIDGFITFDNSISSTVLINKLKDIKIPSFYNFYNGLSIDIIYYDLQIYSQKPDYWLFGGKAHLDAFRKRNKLINNYHIVGDPINDLMLNCDISKEKITIRNKYKFSPSDKIIVLISSYISADFNIERKKILFNSVSRAVKKLGYKLIIKAHPNENIKFLKELLNQLGISDPLFVYENIIEIFKMADLVCLFFSESAQQAMVLQKPIISILPSELLESYDKHWAYYSSHAVYHVPMGDDPTGVIDDLINDPSKRNLQIEYGNTFADYYLNTKSENVTKKIYDFVESKI
jgi:hypothetical protein